MASATLTQIGRETTSAGSDLQPILTRVYAAYRTALLNTKYYGYKLKWARRFNTGTDVVIALATGSGVSGWTIWNTPELAPLWSIIVGTAAVLGLIKPILPLARNISLYAKLHAGYQANFLAMKDLVERIAIERAYTRDMEREFEYLARRYRDMASEDEPDPSRRLIERFQSEVNAQIPPSSLWCPIR